MKKGKWKEKEKKNDCKKKFVSREPANRLIREHDHNVICELPRKGNHKRIANGHNKIKSKPLNDMHMVESGRVTGQTGHRYSNG